MRGTVEEFFSITAVENPGRIGSPRKVNCARVLVSKEVMSCFLGANLGMEETARSFNKLGVLNDKTFPLVGGAIS